MFQTDDLIQKLTKVKVEQYIVKDYVIIVHETL